MNISENICRCASEDCKKYNECYRGKGHKWKPGIYTFSLLKLECNKENNFKLFIEGSDE